MARLASVDRWSDGELLAAIAVGDERAFAVFYGRHLPGVVAFLVRETRDREAAADLAAEVFAAVLLAARRYRDDGEPAGRWVVGIARNKLKVSRRRGRIEERARRRLGYEPVALTDADLERVDMLAAQGDAGSAASLIDSLPAPEREAVRRRVLQEQSYREAAVELRCSELVVRKRVSRGLARIRKEIKE
jgi:RNA polymerase sigma factor (sigma-70 family)